MTIKKRYEIGKNEIEFEGQPFIITFWESLMHNGTKFYTATIKAKPKLTKNELMLQNRVNQLEQQIKELKNRSLF